MSEFEDRLAELRRQADEAEAGRRQDDDAALRQRQAAWGQIYRAAMWARAEYERAGQNPEPIWWEWSEIKPGRQKQIRQIGGHTKYRTTMAVPEYIRHRNEIARGFIIWSHTEVMWESVPGPGEDSRPVYDHYHIVITTSGPAVWTVNGYLAELPGDHVAKQNRSNRPPTPQILTEYAITQWTQPWEFAADQVVDEILLRTQGHK